MTLRQAVLAVALLLALGTRCAQASPTVVVGGNAVMTLAGDKHTSADERARMVQRNVDAAIRARKPATSISAVEKKGVYVITWGGRPICTVDGLQAKANGCSAKELAFRWVRGLRDAVHQGFLAVTPQTAVMGVGTTRTLKVQGLARGPIAVESRGAGITASLTGDAVTIKASAIGRFSLLVRRDGAVVSVPIAVKEPAGTIPERVHQSVSGAPAGRDVLEEAVGLAVHASITARPGATIEMKLETPLPASLSPGAEFVAKMSVSIEGPDYFTVSRVVDIALRNENIAMPPPTLLMVSNRPEKIGGEGVLFRSAFTREQPTRLLYSHVNGSGGVQYLWVNLTNPTSQPIRVQIIQADGGPAAEELYVGHRCNTRFLEDMARNEGVVLTIPANRTFSLGQYRLPPREIVSGLAQMQLVAGDEVVVSVETSPDKDRVGRIDRVVDAPFNPFRIHPKGIFGSPNIVVNETYVVGAPDAREIPFGKAPWLIDPVSGEPNTGNYGVLYEMRVEVQNPTQEVQKVSMYFQPVNGVALGSFLVEGRLLETSCLKPPARQLIGTVELPPQQTRTVRIITMPQAGSHYPARILFQSPVQETTRGRDGI